MIDLHCHILPGVDDGPPRLEDSIALARTALLDGVRTVVATPHGAEWIHTRSKSETLERVAALQAELTRLGLDLELLAGLEVYLTPETPALYAEGGLFTLNASRYLLVEFPLQMVPPHAEQTLFELQLQKVVPVIAHPERNREIAANPEILQRMVKRGMLAQVTASSLTGFFGTRTREVAELLVMRQLVHVIASDAHSPDDRPPCLSDAVRQAAGLIGEEAARAMVTITPAAILRDEEVVLPEPHPAPRRSWFSFGRKK